MLMTNFLFQMTNFVLMTLLTQLTVSVRTVLWFAKIMIKSKKYLRYYIINMPERPEHVANLHYGIPISQKIPASSSLI